MSRTSEREAKRKRMALGITVRRRRSELGISQEVLGYRSKLDRTYISGIERGTRNPTVEVLWRVAAALELPTWELMRRAEEDG